MRMLLVPAPLLLVLAACVDPYAMPLPASPYPAEQPATINYNVTMHQPSATTVSPHRETRSTEVLILQSTHLDRPAEVVGIVDVHEEMGHHDAALEALRRKAAAMGADAVVGVEFHHSDSHAEPTHLSGLAVRFVSALP